MLNSVCLMGRLGADPELRNTPNGIPVTTFRLAVDRTYQAKGQEKQTDWVDIVAWRSTAEFAAKYFRKGSLMAVQGYLQTRRYADREGNNRTAVEVVAEHIFFAPAVGATRLHVGDIQTLEARDVTGRQTRPPQACSPQVRAPSGEQDAPWGERNTGSGSPRRDDGVDVPYTTHGEPRDTGAGSYPEPRRDVPPARGDFEEIVGDDELPF